MKDGLDFQLSESDWDDLFREPAHLGASEPFPIPGVRLHIGAPVTLSLRALLSQGGKSEAEFGDEYDVWIIFHSMSVLEPHSTTKPVAVGLEVDISSPRALVVDVTPSAEYVAAAGVDLRFNAALDLSGRAEAKSDQVSAAIGPASAVAGGKAAVSIDTGAKVSARISYRLLTPVITATGTLTSRSEWWFRRKEGRSLIGDHIVSHTLLLPRGTRELVMQTRVHAALPIFGGLFGASLKPSDWQERTCALEGGLSSRGIVELLPGVTQAVLKDKIGAAQQARSAGSLAAKRGKGKSGAKGR